jgi:hypothetical protein
LTKFKYHHIYIYHEKVGRNTCMKSMFFSIHMIWFMFVTVVFHINGHWEYYIYNNSLFVYNCNFVIAFNLRNDFFIIIKGSQWNFFSLFSDQNCRPYSLSIISYKLYELLLLEYCMIFTGWCDSTPNRK